MRTRRCVGPGRVPKPSRGFWTSTSPTARAKVGRPAAGSPRWGLNSAAPRVAAGRVAGTPKRKRLSLVHMLVSIPPKYAVSQVVGYMKGKSAIHIARTYLGRRQNYAGEHFWARGYFVSTVGRDETVVREYIQRQEEEDKRVDQLNMWRNEPPLGGSR